MLESDLVVLFHTLIDVNSLRIASLAQQLLSFILKLGNLLSCLPQILTHDLGPLFDL
jgi:hypothetical protein